MSSQNSHAENISCLVDTNVVIDLLRRREYALGLIAKWAEEGLLAVSTLTHLEVYHGMKRGEENGTNLLLDGLVSIDVDIPIARQAGRMLGELRSRGLTVSVGDAIIGATALSVGVPLLTNNLAHYPFAGLKVVPALQK